MKRIYLVDTENVNINALAACNNLNEEDLIILFVTGMTNVCQFSDIKLKNINTKANVLKIYVKTGTKNSLDFQLVSYLGFIIGEKKNENNEYYIVSRDRGFLSSISLLENCSNYKIKLIPNVLASFDTINSIDENDMINAFKKLGFRHPTATEMYSIIASHDTYEEAIYKFAFRFNTQIADNCKDILKYYFDILKIA